MVAKNLDIYMYRYLFDNFPLQENTEDIESFDYCKDDFLFYLAYHIRKPNSDCFFCEYIAREALKIKFLDDTEYTPNEEELKIYSKESKKFIKNFIDKWWDRFLNRSQLLLWNQKLNEEQESFIENGTNHVDISDEFSDDELDDIFDYVDDELIKHGEYAFVSKISEELVYGCMASYVSANQAEVNLGTQESKIGLLEKINKEITSLTMDKNRKIVYIIYGAENHKSKEDYS